MFALIMNRLRRRPSQWVKHVRLTRFRLRAANRVKTIALHLLSIILLTSAFSLLPSSCPTDSVAHVCPYIRSVPQNRNSAILLCLKCIHHILLNLQQMMMMLFIIGWKWLKRAAYPYIVYLSASPWTQSPLLPGSVTFSHLLCCDEATLTTSPYPSICRWVPWSIH